MLSVFYNRFKVAFWIILTILFATGSISNISTGTDWEVALNAVLGAVCLIVAITLFVKQRKNEE
ncbi:hypothetical protein [Metabacillus halosaccharovorans]|uniref:hypothetical protein n=1 Tax=Metabacillus halosaccharovorans TaxID=930124 RepID=UPI00203E4C05|nr:hypothetical protein [Metabacillus halosaccharovorans]MCM3442923.1 hypothetical protein [Metabacillus halosaccharovorans]